MTVPTTLDHLFLTNDTDATDVVLVRHGQQHLDGAGTIAELVDPPLSSTGRRQADAVGAHLSDLAPAAVYSSDLRRAADTGAAIARHHDLQPVVVGDLREIATFRDAPQDARVADVMSTEELAAVRRRFVRVRRWDVYPLGERSLEFRRRIMVNLDLIAERHAGETVVVACHGGVVNALVAEVLRVADDMVYRPAHGSVHRFRHRHGHWAIDRLNEQHHLEAADVLTW